MQPCWLRTIVWKKATFTGQTGSDPQAPFAGRLEVVATQLEEDSMPHRNLLTISFAAILIFQTLGCGTSGSSNRVLQSIAVTPATADAKNSNGQVQFTATGAFSKSPSPAPVTFAAPYSGSWSADPTIATLVGTGTGTATFQCVAGASGAATITATASTNAATGTGATSTAVSGTASLTCP
jgi:hypothetical protein